MYRTVIWKEKDIYTDDEPARVSTETRRSTGANDSQKTEHSHWRFGFEFLIAANCEGHL